MTNSPIDVGIDFGDLDEVVREIFGDETAIATTIGAAIYDRWRELADQNLDKTRAAYIAGIQTPQVSGNIVTVALEGVLPGIVENGMNADMRTTHLKPGQDHKVIAFEHAAGKGATGTPLGYGLRALHAARTVDIAARKIGLLARAMTHGQSIKDVAGLRAKPSHVEPLYQRMTHYTESRTASEPARPRYFTFRTLSRNSPQDSWQINVRPRHLALRVEQEMEKIVTGAMEQVVQAVLRALR